MRIESLEYAALEAEIVSALEAAGVIVLASTGAGSVTARSMSPVNIGLDVYMQTDSRFAKVAQMKENPQVALCLGNMQMEGASFRHHAVEIHRRPAVQGTAERCGPRGIQGILRINIRFCK